LRWSARAAGGGTNYDYYIRLNSDSANNYSRTYIVGDGATASSGRGFNGSYLSVDSAGNGTGGTANTFSSQEMYIPNYTGTASKPIAIDSANENNTTTAYRSVFAQLYRGSSAITSITFELVTFAAGSSFHLYGVKNS
jgi:hypothetical protein